MEPELAKDVPRGAKHLELRQRQLKGNREEDLLRYRDLGFEPLLARIENDAFVRGVLIDDNQPATNLDENVRVVQLPEKAVLTADLFLERLR